MNSFQQSVPIPARRQRRRRGFTMVEVMLSMIVFLCMILVFASTLPLAVRSASYANNYAQAATIAQHKIDQLRKVGWSGLTASQASATTVQNELTTSGIIDANSCYTNYSDYSINCTFTSVDNVASTSTSNGFYPQGSSGTIKIQPDFYDDYNYNTYVANVVNLLVTVNWSGGGMPAGSYSVMGKAVEMPHQ